MKTQTFYDAIIIGGGPAGLSVGAELSKLGNKVAIIEKGVIGETNRAWIVPGSIISELDEDVRQFAYNGVKRFMEFTSGLEIQWDATCPWDSEEKWKSYPYIKQKELLCFWADEIRKNGSDVFENKVCIDKETTDNAVKVRVINSNNSEEPFSIEGKLIIDASGYSSQFVKQDRINRKDYFWWSVYGFEYSFDDITKLKHPGNLGNMKVGDYMLWQSFDILPFKKDETLSELRPIMEYEVLDDKTVFVFILYFCGELIDKDFMKSQFEFLVKNDKSIETFKEGKEQTERFGWYPSAGINQKNSKDRIVYIGDAGCWTIAAGWGMSFILQNYKVYAKNLSKNLKNNHFSKKDLDKACSFNTKEKYELLMDKLVLQFLSYAKPRLIDKFTKTVFDAFGGERLEIMFCLRMSRQESVETLKVVLKKFTFKELFSIFKEPKEYILIIQVALEFFKSLIIDMIRKIRGQKSEDAGFRFLEEKESSL